MASKNSTDQDDAPAPKGAQKRKSGITFHLEVEFVPLPPERRLKYRHALATLAQMLLEADQAVINKDFE